MPPAHRRIDGLIFDWGGVFSISPTTGLQALERRLGWAEGALFRLFAAAAAAAGDQPDASPRYLLETGRLALDEFVETIASHAPVVFGEEQVDLAAFRAAFSSLEWLVEAGTNWEVVHRIRELRHDGYRTGLLTNNVAEWSGAWRSTIPVEELFDDVVDSSEVGMRKPDPAIYLLACERLGVAPERTVFLDDAERNVEGARAVGMWGVVVGPDPHEALEQLDRILTEESRAGPAKP